jgi:hypothetical protein
MPLYTREEIASEISRWKDALKACATGKTYTIDGRQLTRYNLDEIRRHLEWLAGIESQLDGQATILARPVVRR